MFSCIISLVVMEEAIEKKAFQYDTECSYISYFSMP